MSLTTMEPTPTWTEDAYAETVETFAAVADEITVRVWGADWCTDCRAQLPDFAAALEAAGVPEESIVQIAVDREKDGDGVAEYGIEYIPTVVVERDGEEIARFVEEADRPIAVVLAEALSAVDPAA